MTQEEQIQKILDLEASIREKQNSVFSAHTLVPVGLVLGAISSVFFFGVTFQRLNSLEQGYVELKSNFKEELGKLQTDIATIVSSVNDIRVLLVQIQESNKKSSIQ
jgi:hypothetical protein